MNVSETAGEASSGVETSSLKREGRGDGGRKQASGRRDCRDPHLQALESLGRGAHGLCAATRIKYSQRRTASKSFSSLCIVCCGYLNIIRAPLHGCVADGMSFLVRPRRQGVWEAGSAIGVCRGGSHQTSKSRRKPVAICRVS